jgi:hypothetical protein
LILLNPSAQEVPVFLLVQSFLVSLALLVRLLPPWVLHYLALLVNLWVLLNLLLLLYLWVRLARYRSDRMDR